METVHVGQLTFTSKDHVLFHFSGLMRLIAEASELLGCVRDKQNFQCFRIPEKRVLTLIQDAASALQKTQEMHL